MTYLQFLLLFLAVPIAVLLWLGRGHRLDTPNIGYWRSVGLVGLIAFAYTTPWDNYLVWSGVWYYGDARVLGTWFHVPYEEYAFFLLQPVLTGLWFKRLLPPQLAAQPSRWPLAFAAVSGLLAVAGAAFLWSGRPLLTYAGLILAWACPVLFALSVFARHTLSRLGSVAFMGVAAPTLYLWIADALAIRLEIWTIALESSTGILILGLPIEEALFFLVTNALVVLGVITFAYGPAWPNPSIR